MAFQFLYACIALFNVTSRSSQSLVEYVRYLLEEQRVVRIRTMESYTQLSSGGGGGDKGGEAISGGGGGEAKGNNGSEQFG